MRAGVSVSEKAPGDLVTTADRALSKLIVGALSQRMPNDLIVSEEGDRQQIASARTWLIDPIDGTDHYVRNSRQFSVMIGLVIEQVPVFGWVYQPTEQVLFFGGPSYGTHVQRQEQAPVPVKVHGQLKDPAATRLIIGRGDARRRPWLEGMPGLTMKAVGSMGVKVIWILEARADVVAQMHGRMSVWDTAGPAAIALGAGLQVGTGDDLSEDLKFPNTYDTATFKQGFPIVMGVPGTLEWARKCLLKQPSGM
jgi:3'-phosphoadenosine 5'-phosphosulfate (PAPS) 3'-phosphatase